MRVEHVAIWTKDLERLRAFYEQYFGATANQKYQNPAKQLETYFLTFEEGARLEIMQIPGIRSTPEDSPLQGYAHLAFSTGSEEAVDSLTKKLTEAGFPAIDGPRHTGDGYYESVVLDPDGNKIEITV
jgi:lactoylglutathione lyase